MLKGDSGERWESVIVYVGLRVPVVGFGGWYGIK